MALEWLSIPAGVVAGAASGFGAAWVGRPGAQAAAETARVEAQARFNRRREVVDNALQLVADATSGNWSPEVVAADQRYLRIRGDVRDVTRAYYVKASDEFMEIPPEGGWDHWRLSDDIGDLAKRWKLT